MIKKETDPNLKNQMIRLEKILTIKFEKNIDDRQKAIFALNDDLGIDVRGVLNPILKTYVDVALTVPEEKNIARKIIPGLSKKNKDGSSFTGRPLIGWILNSQRRRLIKCLLRSRWNRHC